MSACSGLVCIPLARLPRARPRSCSTSSRVSDSRMAVDPLRGLGRPLRAAACAGASGTSSADLPTRTFRGKRRPTRGGALAQPCSVRGSDRSDNKLPSSALTRAVCGACVRRFPASALRAAEAQARCATPARSATSRAPIRRPVRPPHPPRVRAASSCRPAASPHGGPAVRGTSAGAGRRMPPARPSVHPHPPCSCSGPCSANHISGGGDQQVAVQPRDRKHHQGQVAPEQRMGPLGHPAVAHAPRCPAPAIASPRRPPLQPAAPAAAAIKTY